MTGRHHVVGVLVALGTGLTLGSRVTGVTAAELSLAVLTPAAILMVAGWIRGSRTGVLRCPKCKYTVNGPDPARYHLQHLTPSWHVIHGAYGPLAELTNEVGTTVPAELLDQMRAMSFYAGPRRKATDG